MTAVGRLSHSFVRTQWVGCLHMNPLSNWTEDLVQINIPQSRAALHSPRRQTHKWWRRQHGSITSCNGRRTSVTFLLLISSKSLILDFSPMPSSWAQKSKSFLSFFVQQIRGDSLGSCTQNDGFVSMQSQKISLYVFAVWIVYDISMSTLSSMFFTCLICFRESTVLLHVEWLITCWGIHRGWTRIWTLCNRNLKQLPIWRRGPKKQLSTWKILLFQLKRVPHQVSHSIWYNYFLS